MAYTYDVNAESYTRRGSWYLLQTSVLWGSVQKEFLGHGHGAPVLTTPEDGISHFIIRHFTFVSEKCFPSSSARSSDGNSSLGHYPNYTDT